MEDLLKIIEDNQDTINFARNMSSGRVAKLLIKIVDKVEDLKNENDKPKE